MKTYIFSIILLVLNTCHSQGQKLEKPKIGEAAGNETVVFYQTKDFPSGPIAKLLTYRNGNLSRDVTIINDGINRVVTENIFDDLKRLKVSRIKNSNNWTRRVFDYFKGNLIKSEKIIEYNGEKKDTTHFTYEYPPTISYPMVYYRLKQDKRVSEFKLNVIGNKETLVEKALLPENQTNLIITTKIKDKEGNVIEENVQHINQKELAPTVLDTTQINPTTYEYDSYGNIVKEYSTDLFGNQTGTFNYYDQNKYLKRKLVKSNGRISMNIVLEKR